MQTIILKDNLSEHFDLITYPDGQHSIKLHLDKLNVKEWTIIKCRIKNFSELEVLHCLVFALRKYDFSIKSIHYMYLFGLRSDRSFWIGGPNYCHILRPIICNLSKDRFIYFPHSSLWIDSTKNNYNLQFDHMYQLNSDVDFGRYEVIAGDESAIKIIGGNKFFSKKRTPQGVQVEMIGEMYSDKNILIVDDLCDGGATFIAEAEYLKKHYPEKILSLFVVHGLFTKGLEQLLEYFDEIICTNSYQDIDHPKVKQIKVI